MYFKSCIHWILLCSTFHTIDSQTLRIEPEEASVEEYGQVQFTCTSNVSSTVTLYRISWLISNGASAIVIFPACTSTADSSKYTFTCDVSQRTFTWTILNVTREYHDAICSCQLLTELPSPNQVLLSNGATINIKVPVTFVQMLEPSKDITTVIENRSIQFTCLAPHGRPAATIKWYIDNRTPEDITDDIEISETSSSTNENQDSTFNTTSHLTFVVLRTHNKMKMYCTANNTETSEVISNRKPILDVHYPPDESPTLHGVLIGDTYKMIRNSNTMQRLTCMIADGNPLPTLIWTCYDGESIQNITGTIAYSTLTWIGSNQERTCTCKASHSLLTKELKASVNVELLYPPTSSTFEVGTTPVESPGPIEITEGETMSVKCSSLGNPMPQSYTWQLSDGTTHQGQQLEIIPNVQTSGNNIQLYTCIASNTMAPSIGTTIIGSSSSRLIVIVSFSPRPACDVPLVTRIKAELQSRVILTFTAVAYPIPAPTDYVWQTCTKSLCAVLVNGHNINISTNGLVTNLTFNSIQETDFGTYRLIVSNGIGDDYTHEYAVLSEDSAVSSSNPALVGGAVGGGVGAVVVITVVVLVVLLHRRRRPGANPKSSTKREAPTYAEISMAGPATSAYDSVVASASTVIESAVNTERTDTSYSGLTQYGNVQNTYEQIDTTEGEAADTNLDTVDDIGDNPVVIEEQIDSSYVNEEQTDSSYVNV